MVQLTCSGYDRPNSPKILDSPTQKDYINIVQFMMRYVPLSLSLPTAPVVAVTDAATCRRIDPVFTFGQKVDEELIDLFKRLKYDDLFLTASLTLTFIRYPVPITKSSVQAIGAPHTWPFLLASLYWLLELVLVQSLT